jgi:hypothetical protein
VEAGEVKNSCPALLFKLAVQDNEINTMSTYQEKYWAQLKELKTHVIYLQGYAEHADWWDKTVDIFLAITSSSSIAAWAVWQKYPLVWGAIIALSQIITAIKPFLPYKQRVRAISELTDKIQNISLKCEKGWFSVAEGKLTEEEIHELYINLKQESVSAEQTCLKNVVLPEKQKILSEAEKKTELYLTNTYHSGAHHVE